MAEPELLDNGFYRVCIPNVTRKNKVKLLYQNAPFQQHPFELLFRKHAPRKPHPLLPTDRTLFLCNLPVDVAVTQLNQFFGKCGKIERTVIGQVGDLTTKEDLELRAQQEKETIRTPHKSGEIGFLVFKKAGSLDRLHEIHASHWNCKASMSLGLENLQQSYLKNQLNLAQFEESAKQVIAQYDAQRAEEERLSKERTVDENGFILVPKKRGSNHSVSKIKPKEKIFKDFYGFQMKEEKRNRLQELRTKFEKDKQKIEELRKNRRFKPY